MNITVFIKSVFDTETNIKISSDKKSVDSSNVNYVINPYDEYAIEEALKIKEKLDGKVKIVCLGDEKAKEIVRKAIAMGADEGVLLKTDTVIVDSFKTAIALAMYAKENPADIYFFGKEAVDYNNSQVGSLFAQMLDLPAITNIVKFEINDNKATAHKEAGNNTEVVECSLPAVFTAQKGLNEPRYASLKGIMQAKNVAIDEKDATMVDSMIEIINVELPPERKPGKIIGEGPDTVPELVKLLKEEAKVL